MLRGGGCPPGHAAAAPGAGKSPRSRVPTLPTAEKRRHAALPLHAPGVSAPRERKAMLQPSGGAFHRIGAWEWRENLGARRSCHRSSAAPVPCMVQGGRTRLLHLTPSHPAKRVSPRACCRAVWSLQMRDQSQDHSIITLNSLAVSAFVLVPNYWGTSVPTLLLALQHQPGKSVGH